MLANNVYWQTKILKNERKCTPISGVHIISENTAYIEFTSKCGSIILSTHHFYMPRETITMIKERVI